MRTSITELAAKRLTPANPPAQQSARLQLCSSVLRPRHASPCACPALHRMLVLLGGAAAPRAAHLFIASSCPSQGSRRIGRSTAVDSMIKAPPSRASAWCSGRMECMAEGFICSTHSEGAPGPLRHQRNLMSGAQAPVPWPLTTRSKPWLALATYGSIGVGFATLVTRTCLKHPLFPFQASLPYAWP